MKQFTRVEIQKEVQKQLPENDVLLAFYDDDGAAAFEEWWRSDGVKVFYSWLERSTEFSYLCNEQ